MQVWAMDPETGEKALKTVVRTFVNESDELIHVHTGADEIICTPEHPFYVPTKGWTGAAQLRAGDILVLRVPSRFMRKFICRLRLNEVSRQ